MSIWENNEEIKIFREYLRIPTVHPNVDYASCIAFLIQQAKSLDLPYKIYYPGNNPLCPVCVITWLGIEPALPSILLNSHMDVVPVFEEKWIYPPFAAEIDDDGRIYARGTQDMKSVGMQYLAALRNMKRNGITTRRTIHVSFVPDEEIGGYTGMGEFVKSAEFKELNVGFALDEGMASADDTYYAFYAERSIWQINFKISGTAGHGSLLLENTAASKLQYLLNKFMAYRAEETSRLESNPSLFVGDVTTINLTQIKGGVQSNVVPPMLEACFDIRIAIDVDLVAFEETILQWCTEAGGGIELEWIQKYHNSQATKIDDTNVYWTAFKEAVDQLGIRVKTYVFSGGTDSEYIRALGIPAIGFSPINNTPILLHDNDEYLGADTYLEGIDIYSKILEHVANLS